MKCMIDCCATCVYIQDKSSVQQQSPEALELSAKLEKVEDLERQIEDQKFKISQLREEKVSLKQLYFCLNYLHLHFERHF